MALTVEISLTSGLISYTEGENSVDHIKVVYSDKIVVRIIIYYLDGSFTTYYQCPCKLFISTEMPALTLHYQEFTANGTFTPSAALLALGGVVTVHIWGGGGPGGEGGGTLQYGGGGGGAGMYIKKHLTLSAGVITVTCGAAAQNSTFGNLITALAGLKGGTHGAYAGEGCGGAGSVNGSNGTFGSGGVGGSALGIGVGGMGSIDDTNGANASGYASGGGGGCIYGHGGTGTPGYCLVEWYE